jgi:hypothetical protein
LDLYLLLNSDILLSFSVIPLFSAHSLLLIAYAGSLDDSNSVAVCYILYISLA